MGENHTDNTQRLVPCSFCNEELLPSAIGGHLMNCGNKTDQCPNCTKYIRRAIFAYHYENNCADLDESEADVDVIHRQTETPSSIQPNRPSLSSSRSAAENNKTMTIRTVYLDALPNPSTTATSQQSDSGTTTSVCPYCGYECDLRHNEKHREQCLQKPKNVGNTQQLQNNNTSNQNTVRLNHADQTNETVDIPCEYCNKPIKWCDYRYHMETCGTQDYRPLHEHSQHGYRAEDPASARCKYCNKGYMVPYVEQHERNCKQSPLNIALEEQHRAVFSLIPPVDLLY